jgi:type II secretory pathway pseudopilin PulG
MKREYRIWNGRRKRNRASVCAVLHSQFPIPFSCGFTIIETLIGMVILLLSMSAPLLIAEKGLASAQVARQEINAFYLAQEAIEYLRNVRDTDALAKRNWLQGFNNCRGAEGCGVDPTAPQAGQRILRCGPANDDCAVWQYTAEHNPAACTQSPLCGLFGHRTSSGWTKTSFTRTALIAEVTDGVEARVQVTVSWNGGALGSRTVTLSENLMNWYTP